MYLNFVDVTNVVATDAAIGNEKLTENRAILFVIPVFHACGITVAHFVV